MQSERNRYKSSGSRLPIGLDHAYVRDQGTEQKVLMGLQSAEAGQVVGHHSASGGDSGLLGTAAKAELCRALIFIDSVWNPPYLRQRAQGLFVCDSSWHLADRR